MLSFARATQEDAEQLTEVSIAAFDDDSRVYREIESGGPPGYNSIEWQISVMEWSNYHKIILDGKIIGGIIVFKSKEDGSYFLGRIFIEPSYQNKGYGKKAMKYIEEYYLDSKKWQLDTPQWSVRNHHFYEKCGYIRTGVQGEDGYKYEKDGYKYEKDTDSFQDGSSFSRIG
jgi:GNAT superfamily N-acetyltransferase